MCLQETYLKPDDSINFKGFNMYNYIYEDGRRPSGGSSMLVHSSCPQREIVLTTEFQSCRSICYPRYNNYSMFCLYTTSFVFAG